MEHGRLYRVLLFTLVFLVSLCKSVAFPRITSVLFSFSKFHFHTAFRRQEFFFNLVNSHEERMFRIEGSQSSILDPLLVLPAKVDSQALSQVVDHVVQFNWQF